MTSATERHGELVDAGWSVRLDGLWRPPPDWHDHRAYTPAAAWEAHTASFLPNGRPADSSNSPHTHIGS
jgi:hypothetical protein